MSKKKISWFEDGEMEKMLDEYNRKNPPAKDNEQAESEKAPIDPPKNDEETVIPPMNDSLRERYEKTLLSATSEQKGVMDKIGEYVEDLGERYDALLDKLTNSDYKDIDRYRNIVDEYTAIGEKMAKNAASSSAAENSGNFDTFSAANAHRQAIAYKNAGEAAAADAYDRDIERYANILGDYAADTKDAYSLYSSSAGEMDDFTLSQIDDLADSQKLAIESAKAGAGSLLDLSGEIDPNNQTNRFDTYMNMLIAIYPDYAEEIHNYFHHI